MSKLFITFAAAALLFTLGGPAQAFEFRIEASQQRGFTTVPSVGTRGYMWLDRSSRNGGQVGTQGYCWDNRGSMCQYN